MLPSVGITTYRTNYKGEQSSLPRIKYKTLPCLYPPGSMVPCRKQAYGVTAKPKFITAEVPHLPSPPVVPKPVPKQSNLSKETGVRKNKVLETKFGPMDMSTIEDLYNKYRYTTFTQKAADEVPFTMIKVEPPTTTKEDKPDMIRLKGQRYDEEPELWQDAALWDRIQTRPSTELRPMTPNRNKLLQRRPGKVILTSNFVLGQYHFSSPAKLHIDPRTKAYVENTMLDTSKLELIRELVKTGRLASVFVRKVPGYAGYTFLCPPETNVHPKPNPVAMTSVMAESYKSFPDIVYQRTGHERQGHFSKTVTLGSPFNPFNKVGEDVSPPRKTVYTVMLDNMHILSS